MLTSRDQILAVNVDAIPESLKQIDRWVIFKAEPKRGDPEKLDKVPYCAFDPSRHASHSDARTWSTFEVALNAYQQRATTGADGLLIATGEGLAGLDVDSVFDPGRGGLTEEIRAVLAALNSYSELSVSGTGVRVFVFGQEAKGVRRGAFEIYSRKRFLSVTGHHLSGTPMTVEPRDAELDALRQRLRPQRDASRCRPATVFTRHSVVVSQATPQGVSRLGISDEEIIATVQACRPEFAALWEGDASAYDGDRSRADMAMASYLAYYCGPGEHERVLQIMHQSGLVRDKWLNRPEYLSEMTIPRAYESLTQFHDWGAGPLGGGVRRRAAPQIATEPGDIACDDGDESESGESRPTIVIGPETDAILTEVECHLGAHLFQRDGKLVAVEQAEMGRQDDAVRRKAGALVIKTQSEEQVERLMSRHLRFVKSKVVGSGRNRRLIHEAVAAPTKLAKLFTKCSQWRNIPHLTGIVATPFMRRDGSIVWTPGYDEATGVLFVDDGTEWTRVPDAPTQEQVEAAAADLSEVVCDFPFELPHHLSSWIAALLQVVGRHAIDGPVPMLCVDANRKGTGKTKLPRAVSRIVCGADPTEISFTSDEKELENRLGSILLAGDRFFVFDNATGSIRNPVLDRFLTSRWFDFRRFHAQELAKPLNDSSAAITGNNLTLRGDLSRRVLRVRLVTEDESPERRNDFRHADLDGFIAANRVRLFAAAMTILKAHAAAGFARCAVRTVAADGTVAESMPRSVGSFTEWDRVVRHAVLRAGFADPVASQDEVRAEDEDEVKLRAFLSAWHRHSPDCEGTATALIKQWFGGDGRETTWRQDLLDLREAVHELTGTEIGRVPSSQTLGYRLRDARDKKVGGYRVVKSEKKTNAGYRYAVVCDGCAADAPGGGQPDVSTSPESEADDEGDFPF